MVVPGIWEGIPEVHGCPRLLWLPTHTLRGTPWPTGPLPHGLLWPQGWVTLTLAAETLGTPKSRAVEANRRVWLQLCTTSGPRLHLQPQFLHLPYGSRDGQKRWRPQRWGPEARDPCPCLPRPEPGWSRLLGLELLHPGCLGGGWVPGIGGEDGPKGDPRGARA